MNFSTIEDVRNAIDGIDSQLVSLIAERGRLVKAAAGFKKDQDAVRAPDRVQRVIDKVRAEAAVVGLPEDIIEKVYRTMINAFIDYELEQHRSRYKSSIGQAIANRFGTTRACGYISRQTIESGITASASIVLMVLSCLLIRSSKRSDLEPDLGNKSFQTGNASDSGSGDRPLDAETPADKGNS